MVAKVEAPTSGPTPDADETTSSPHQPTNDQLAVVSLPTGDTPLPTDFQPNDIEATATEIGGLQSAVTKFHTQVAEVEAPMSAAMPDADETTNSSHQPTTDQLAVVPLPTGGAPLPTDFLVTLNEPDLIAPTSGTVGPFNSLSNMPIPCSGVSSDTSGAEKYDYDLEKAQTTPFQIHNPDDDTFHGSAMSRMPLSSKLYPHNNGMEDAAIEIGGLQSAVVKLQIQNGPSLPTPNSSSELFSIHPEACLSGCALSSEPNYAEKHENHTQRTQATPVDIVCPDGSEPRIGCKEGDLSPGLADAVTMATEGSASSVPPAPASEVTSSLFSMPHQPCLQARIPHTGGTQLSNDETQTTLVEPSSSTDIIEPARHLSSLPHDLQPLSHSNPVPAREARNAVEESQSPLYSEGHIPLQDYDPFDGSFPTVIVCPDGSEPRIGCKEGDLSPGLADAVTIATEGSASSVPPAPASEVTSSLFSTPHQPCLQAGIPHTGGTQLSNDETQTTLVEPSSSTDIIEPARHLSSLPHDIQPLSHSNPGPAREARNAVEESQSPLYSEDHTRLQDYDPFDGSFPTVTVNRGRYTGPNAVPVPYSPYESSQIRRSPVQDYYPNEPNYRLPRYRQGDRYQEQRESSSTSELTYKRWAYGDQYQGQEYDVSQPCRVSNPWQRYYPVNDIPDDRPWSRGGRHQGRDYHDSNNDNFDDGSWPFEVGYKDQVCHLGNAESDDMPRPHARQYRKHDYSDGTNVFNDMHQPRRPRYQQQSYFRDEQCLGEAPQPYGSHYERREDWPAEKNRTAMPQSYRVHYQRQADRLGDNIVDGVPPHHTSQYQGGQSWSSNCDVVDVQRTEREPANFPGNDDFADMPRTEQEHANFPGNDNFADVQRTERGPANFLSNDSIQNVASQWKDHYQRPKFAEFKSHDAFPTNHELEYMHSRTHVQGGDFRGVYQTTADPDFQKDPCGSRRSCYRDYSLNHELQSQKDQCYDVGSASKDENTPQLTGENCATEEKSSSQAGERVGCESGTLVCDNIVSVPNSVNVVIGERNRAGGKSGGRITGNRILR